MTTPPPTGEPLRPPSTLIIGPAGTGKTSCLWTAMACGLSVRMLATEPSAPNRVISWMQAKNIPGERFDWTIVSPASASWDGLIESARMVRDLTIKQLADLTGGIAKKESDGWLSFLMAMNEFKSMRTGNSLGCVNQWPASTMFVIDGLTGVNTMSRALTVGLKPNPNPGEWGIMQNNILRVIEKLCADLSCFFTCIAHVEREPNELTGLANITVSTLGSKLAPKLPPLFTNVVLAERRGKDFFWSTEAMNTDTKAGDLPIDPSLKPDFAQIVNLYHSRQKAAMPSAAIPTTAQTA